VRLQRQRCACTHVEGKFPLSLNIVYDGTSGRCAQSTSFPATSRTRKVGAVGVHGVDEHELWDEVSTCLVIFFFLFRLCPQAARG
jgi:hypothetical protein